MTDQQNQIEEPSDGIDHELFARVVHAIVDGAARHGGPNVHAESMADALKHHVIACYATLADTRMSFAEEERGLYEACFISGAAGTIAKLGPLSSQGRVHTAATEYGAGAVDLANVAIADLKRAQQSAAQFHVQAERERLQRQSVPHGIRTGRVQPQAPTQREVNKPAVGDATSALLAHLGK